MAQAKSMEYEVKFFGVDGMDGILTLEGFDTTLAEGVMLLTPFTADAQDERTVSFVTKYQELYNEVPNQFAADGYDCVYRGHERFGYLRYAHRDVHRRFLYGRRSDGRRDDLVAVRRGFQGAQGHGH
jgi:hypothetical protein